MKKNIVIVFFLVGLFRISSASCFEDYRTLTEILFSENPGTIFTCKILTTRLGIQETSDGHSLYQGDNISTAKIIKVYFGKVDSLFITINTGDYNAEGSSLTVGNTYIIYSRDHGILFRCCSICDRWSKLLSIAPAVNDELDLLNQFSEIVNSKKTGYFIFKNPNGIVMAEGSYKNGQAVGIWKHFKNGTIWSLHDLKKKRIVQYYGNGFIQSSITTKRHKRISLFYSKYFNGQIETKEIDAIKSADYIISKFITYYDGKILKIHTQGDKDHITDYREYFYPYGKIMVKGQNKNSKRIGIWKWYDYYGKVTKQIDYKDGNTGIQDY